MNQETVYFVKLYVDGIYYMCCAWNKNRNRKIVNTVILKIKM